MQPLSRISMQSSVGEALTRIIPLRLVALQNGHIVGVVADVQKCVQVANGNSIAYTVAVLRNGPCRGERSGSLHLLWPNAKCVLERRLVEVLINRCVDALFVSEGQLDAGTHRSESCHRVSSSSSSSLPRTSEETLTERSGPTSLVVSSRSSKPMRLPKSGSPSRFSTNVCARG